MDSVRVKARAKINLSIDIKGLMDNGYHDVEMVMQSINLSDTLLIKKTSEDFYMTSSSLDVPLDQRNIIYKTWKLLKDKFSIKSGIYVFLEKNIPIAAGMAGGSSDSAAMIVGINELFDLKMTKEEMKEISYELGSDIAFCFDGGTQLATGRGIDLEVLPQLRNDFRVLVCKPDVFVSTKRVYKKFDMMYENSAEIKNRPDNKGLIQGLEDNNLDKIISSMGNVLEPVTKDFCYEVDLIEKIMHQYGAISVMMTGSGPTVFGFFKDYNAIKKCSIQLRKKYKQTYITSISDIGVETYGNRKFNNR